MVNDVSDALCLVEDLRLRCSCGRYDTMIKEIIASRSTLERGVPLFSAHTEDYLGFTPWRL